MCFLKNIWIVSLILAGISLHGYSQVSLYSRADGNWNTTTNWSLTDGGGSCACIPSDDDDIHIKHIVNMNVSGSAKDVTVYNGGELRWTAGTVNLNLYGGGTVTVNSGGFINENAQSNSRISFQDAGTYSVVISDATNGLKMDFIEMRAAANITFSGSGKIHVTTDIQYYAANVKITNNVTGTFQVDRDILSWNNGKWTNNQPLTVGDDIVMPWAYSTYSGTDSLMNYSTLTMTDAFLHNAGNTYIYNDASGTITCSGQLVNDNLDDNNTIVNYGTFTMTDSIDLNGAEYTLKNYGTFDMNGNFVDWPASGTRAVYNYAGSTFKWAGNSSTNAQLYCNYDANTFEYDRAGAQNIITPQDNYINLEIDGGNVKTLQADISVTTTLTLTNGKVDIGNYNLTIGNSGSVSGGSSSNFVTTTGTGYLRQQNIGSGGRTGSISFPVGSSTSSYTPVTIDNSTGTADRFDVKVCNNIYNDGNCSGGTQLTTDVVSKTWTINEGTATGSNASITLQWNASEEATDFTRANCKMSHHNGSVWEYVQAAAAASGSDPYTRTATGVSSFSPFGIGNDNYHGGGPLPIDLTQFTAELIEREVHLKWQTATELNNDYFTIERSPDAINFESIGTIPGAGNSFEEKNYAAADKHPLPGVSYYRLKQTDYNGNFEYKDMVAVKNDLQQDVFSVKMSPNPSDGLIKLDVAGIENTTVNIAVYNPYGEELYFGSWFMTGTTALIIDLSENLASGTYIVTAESGSSLWSEKLIVR